MPEYSRKLAEWVKNARRMSEDAKSRLKEEVPEINDLEWRRMDPRQYDPRRIIKEALLEDLNPAAPAAGDPHGQSFAPSAPGTDQAYGSEPLDFQPLAAGTPAPFDSDAT